MTHAVFSTGGDPYRMDIKTYMQIKGEVICLMQWRRRVSGIDNFGTDVGWTRRQFWSSSCDNVEMDGHCRRYRCWQGGRIRKETSIKWSKSGGMYIICNLSFEHSVLYELSGIEFTYDQTCSRTGRQHDGIWEAAWCEKVIICLLLLILGHTWTWQSILWVHFIHASRLRYMAGSSGKFYEWWGAIDPFRKN